MYLSQFHIEILENIGQVVEGIAEKQADITANFGDEGEGFIRTKTLDSYDTLFKR